MSTIQSEEPAAAPQEPGVSTRTVEAVVALLLFALGAVVAFNSWQLGAGWRDDGPGAGYFPFYIALLICTASAVIGAGGGGAPAPQGGW
ncbi:MAG TPA: hypothetical protein VLE45_08245, partial [Burkholderiaceae bacterium]|nr:hypothetical protein [Burkholderiaceae bacterium]